MNFWVNLAILVVTTLISRALAPKPPKQKPPTLEDFQLPTAEAGRPVPVVFGEVTITGPNCVWYGDLGVEAETQDGVRTRRYFLGIHFVLCHGPVDAFLRVEVGSKNVWTGSQETSGTIALNAPGLFGGRDGEGGIAGDLAVMMGEATQPANAYLTGVLGTPQPAFRGVLSAVLEGGLVSANTTYLKPWAFRVRRLSMGWADGCWYPATVGVPRQGYDQTTLRTLIESYSPVMYLRFEETVPAQGHLSGETVVNDGSGPDGEYVAWGMPRNKLVPDGKQSVGLWYDSDTEGEIEFPDDAAYRYYDLEEFTIAVMVQTDEDFTSTGVHYLYHHGNHSIAGNQGLAIAIERDYPTAGTDSIACGYYASGAFRWVYIALPTPLENSTRYFFGFVLGVNTGGDHNTGYISVYQGCDGTLIGTESFPNYAVPTTTYSLHIGSVAGDQLGGNWIPSDSFKGAIDDFVILPVALTDGQMIELAGEYCLGEPRDMNPAHIIYQTITEPAFGMGYPASVINDASFRSAADAFFSEGMGLSLQWVQQSSVEEFQQEILDHCGAILRMNWDGEFELKPIRGDYDAATLTVYDESEIVAVESWERAGYGELIGEVSVVYTDQDTNTDQTVTLQNLATVQSQQGVVAETAAYPGLPYHDLAARVAQRDLDARSVPLARGRVVLNRSAWGVLPGDVIKISWARLGLTEVIVRILSADYGSLADGRITLDVAEDVFGLPDSAYATDQATAWTDVSTPAETADVRVTEDGFERATENNILRGI